MKWKYKQPVKLFDVVYNAIMHIDVCSKEKCFNFYSDSNPLHEKVWFVVFNIIAWWLLSIFVNLHGSLYIFVILNGRIFELHNKWNCVVEIFLSNSKIWCIKSTIVLYLFKHHLFLHQNGMFKNTLVWNRS